VHVVRNSQPNALLVRRSSSPVVEPYKQKARLKPIKGKRGTSAVHKDDRSTGMQSGDSNPARIETIEELLRKRGFFDSAERWEKNVKEAKVLVS
jgi:hypothetical protein